MVKGIADKIRGAQQAAMAVIGALRVGTCDIYEATDSTSTYEDVVTWAKVAAGVPCRLSYQAAPDADDSNTADTLRQTVRLYVAPNISVKAGSRIDVTQCGVTTSYRDSGKMMAYGTHNEIDLQLLEDYA